MRAAARRESKAPGGEGRLNFRRAAAVALPVVSVSRHLQVRLIECRDRLAGILGDLVDRGLLAVLAAELHLHGIDAVGGTVGGDGVSAVEPGGFACAAGR